MKIAVIGATGAVGREMLAELEKLPRIDIELGLFASPKSAGTSLSFRGRRLVVQPYTPAALQPYPYILLSAGGEFSKTEVPKLSEMGATIIDNSSTWRLESGVPLIIPEVNADELENFNRGVIANPNCSTIQMLVALKPLKDNFGLSMLHVSTYQSVSGSGQKGLHELSRQVEDQYKFKDPEAEHYDQPIAFNLLPAIDVLDKAGHGREEYKMIEETKKIFKLPNLPILATTVRVPVFNCHGESIHVQLGEAVTIDQVTEAFEDAPGVALHLDHDHKTFPTPRSVTGSSLVHVTRLRLPMQTEKSDWLQFWNIADNLKKGAATNAVQIVELLTNKNS